MEIFGFLLNNKWVSRKKSFEIFLEIAKSSNFFSECLSNGNILKIFFRPS